MPSPFPGMDPYLEGRLWPDVHQALAARLRDQLSPQLRPRYIARLNVRVVRDAQAEEEIGISYPNVGVFRQWQTDAVPASGTAIASTITPAVLTIPAWTVEVRIVTVEIRLTETNAIVIAIEIISPVNKRGKGLRDYRRKRQAMRSAGVHLLEIDLLRRGTRVVPGPRVPACDYLVSLTRVGTGATDLWPFTVRERLPVLPVPLHDGDDDLPLVLKTDLEALYDAAGYDLSIDYTQPPPPPELSPEDAAWVREVTGRT